MARQIDKSFSEYKSRMKELIKYKQGTLFYYLNLLKSFDLLIESHGIDIIKHFKITVMDTDILVKIFNQLREYGSAEFIQESLKDLLVLHGFKIEEQGVGWIVTV